MIFSLEYFRQRVEHKKVDTSMFYGVIAEHIKELCKDPRGLHIRDFTPHKHNTNVEINPSLIDLILAKSPQLPTDNSKMFAKLFSKYPLRIDVDVLVGMDEWEEYIYEPMSIDLEPNDYESLNKFFKDIVEMASKHAINEDLADDLGDCLSLLIFGFYIPRSEGSTETKFLYFLGQYFLTYIADSVYDSNTEITEELMASNSDFFTRYTKVPGSFNFKDFYNSIKGNLEDNMPFLIDVLREVVLCSIDSELSLDVLDRSAIDLSEDINVTVHSISNISYRSIPLHERSFLSQVFITHPREKKIPDLSTASYDFLLTSYNTNDFHDKGFLQTNALNGSSSNGQIPVSYIRYTPTDEELYVVLVDITAGGKSYTKLLCLSGLEIHKIPYLKYVQDKLTLEQMLNATYMNKILSTIDMTPTCNTLAHRPLVNSLGSSEVRLSYPLVCYCPADFSEIFDKEAKLLTYEEFKQTDLSNVLEGLINNAKAYLTTSGSDSPPLNTFMYLKNYSTNPESPSSHWVRFIEEYGASAQKYLSAETVDKVIREEEYIDSLQTIVRRSSVRSVNQGHGVLVFTDQCTEETDIQIDIPYPVRDRETGKLSVCPVNIKVYYDTIMVVSSELLMSDFIVNGTYATAPTSLKDIKNPELIEYLQKFDDVGISNHHKTVLSDQEDPLYFYNTDKESQRVNAIDCITDDYYMSTLNVLEYTFNIPFASAKLLENRIDIYEVPHFYMFLQIWNSIPHKAKAAECEKNSAVSTTNRLTSLIPLLAHKKQLELNVATLYREVSNSYKELLDNTFLSETKALAVEHRLADVEAQAKNAGITKVRYYNNVAVFETPPLYVLNTEIEMDNMYSFLGRYLIIMPINSLKSDDLPTNYNIVPLDFRPRNNAALHTSAGGDQCMGNLASLLVEATTYESFFGLVIKSLKSYNVGDAWGVPVLNSYPLVHSSLLKKLLKHDRSCIASDEVSLSDIFIPLKGINLLDYDPYQAISYLDSNITTEELSKEDIKNLLIKSINELDENTSIYTYKTPEDMIYKALSAVYNSVRNNTEHVLNPRNFVFNRIKHNLHSGLSYLKYDTVFDATFNTFKDYLSTNNGDVPRIKPTESIRDYIEDALPDDLSDEHLDKTIDKYMKMYQFLVNKVKLKIFSL